MQYQSQKVFKTVPPIPFLNMVTYNIFVASNILHSLSFATGWPAVFHTYTKQFTSITEQLCVGFEVILRFKAKIWYIVLFEKWSAGKYAKVQEQPVISNNMEFGNLWSQAET